MFIRIASYELHLTRDRCIRTQPTKSYGERTEGGGVDALFMGHMLVISKAPRGNGWECEGLSDNATWGGVRPTIL